MPLIVHIEESEAYSKNLLKMIMKLEPGLEPRPLDSQAGTEENKVASLCSTFSVFCHLVWLSFCIPVSPSLPPPRFSVCLQVPPTSPSILYRSQPYKAGVLKLEVGNSTSYVHFSLFLPFWVESLWLLSDSQMCLWPPLLWGWKGLWQQPFSSMSRRWGGAPRSLSTVFLCQCFQLQRKEWALIRMAGKATLPGKVTFSWRHCWICSWLNKQGAWRYTARA